MSQFFILIDDDRKQNALAYIDALNLSRPYSVEIKQYKKNRSHAQNRLYWSWLHILSEHSGHTEEDLHEMFKARLLGVELRHVWGHAVSIPKSTAMLKTQEFTDYLDKIEALAKTMGLTLPHPDDYRYAMMGVA